MVVIFSAVNPWKNVSVQLVGNCHVHYHPETTVRQGESFRLRYPVRPMQLNSNTIPHTRVRRVGADNTAHSEINTENTDISTVMQTVSHPARQAHQ